MTGNNKLLLNEATLIAAVQLYLDSRFITGESPRVVSVKPAAKTGVYSDAEYDFEVRITDASNP